MSFFEFNIAVSGLFAAQRGLAVTSNNIANATTTGYSRQILEQEASTPLKGMGVGMLGSGVSTTQILRARDSYLDIKLWSQNGKLGEYRVKLEQNSIIESVYGEPSDVGFTKVFNDLFNSIDNLSKLPDEKERQAALRQQVINYTSYFNNISTSLSNFQRDLNFELKTKVDEINLLGSKIQNLNKQIYQAEMYGDDANTFRDQRELCVDRLSQLINVEAKETEVMVDGRKQKQFSVKVAGQTLVDHLFVRELTVEVRGTREQQINELTAKLAEASETLHGPSAALLTPAEITELEDTIKAHYYKLKTIHSGIEVESGNVDDLLTDTYKLVLGTTTLVEDTQLVTTLVYQNKNEQDIDSLYDIKWRDGLPFDMTDENMSGELKGIIDMRDGCGTGANVQYNGIPYYIKRMDQYVRDFAQNMNETYSKDEDGFIMLATIPATVITPEEAAFKKLDTNGNMQYYDQNKTLLNIADINPNDYHAKYQLFAYTDGNSSGTPDANADLSNDYQNMTAANFSIAYDIFDSASNIRTNYQHIPNVDPNLDINPEPNNTDLLLALSAQKTNKKMFKEGDPKDYMIAMFSELGINTQEATMYYNTQTAVTKNIDNQRLAISQVDTNEEFVNLIKYQQAYQAAAKMINTIDGIYETTIFKLGNF